MSNKEKYISFAEKKEGLPLFFQPWWLECVCKGRWDVIIYEEHNEILAAMVYLLHKTHGFTTMVAPPLTPFCGIYSKEVEKKSLSARYTWENKITEYFAKEIDSLNYSYISLPLSTQTECWLGFYWNSFSSQLRYTYQLDVQDMEQCREGFSRIVNRKIKAGDETLNIIHHLDNLPELYKDLQQTFASQKMTAPVSYSAFEEIIQQAEKRNQGKLFQAVDKENKVQAFLFVAWDNTTCYSLLSAIKEKENQQSAQALLHCHAIEHAHSLGLKTYDFEGSMIKGVENFFRAFGGKRCPYICIQKSNSKLFSLLKKIKNH